MPLTVDLPDRETRFACLGPLWARARIAQLSGDLLTPWGNVRASELEKAITDLAVQFRLASAYTAFVAVDESKVVGDGKPTTVVQPVELPEDVDRAGVGAGG